jgi:hypothetical protein
MRSERRRHCRNGRRPSGIESVTNEGTPHGRFQRPIHARHVQNAETAAREMGGLSLADALLLCELLAKTDVARYERGGAALGSAVHRRARTALSEVRSGTGLSPGASAGCRSRSECTGREEGDTLVVAGHWSAKGSGDLAAPDESTNNHACQQQLHVSRKATGSVPTVAPVKQLRSARAKKWYDVLEIRSGACRCSESRRIEGTASAGEEGEAEGTATDFEAARANVLVWQAVAREVEDRPQKDRPEPGSAHGTGRSARRDMERDNHGLSVLAPSPRTPLRRPRSVDCVSEAATSRGKPSSP